MFVVSVQAHYDSAHYLRNYRGKCERLHGHRYVVELALATAELDAAGIAFDFVVVKKFLRELADHLDHQCLNDLEPFTELEPSAENQAKWFWEELKKRFSREIGAAMLYTRVWETPTQWAQYSDRALFA